MPDPFANAKKKPERVRLLLAGDMLDEHADLERQLADAADDARTLVAEQIVELEKRMVDAEIEFVFEPIGRGRWRKLIADHPPTDDEKAEGRIWNGDTFPIAAMLASMREPRVAPDEFQALYDDVLTEEQFSSLWLVCLTANGGVVASHPESQAARATLANAGGKSRPPSGSGSAEAS